MDDLKFGTRDKRGNWTPDATLEIAPFWTGKWGQMGHFLKDYVWPWNAFHMATALLYWAFVLPDIETMKTFGWGWALYLFAVNAAGIFLLYGAIELFYYVKRKQETRFKFNAKFPSENPSDVFWFKSQNLDNFLRSFFVGIPIWDRGRGRHAVVFRQRHPCLRLGRLAGQLGLADPSDAAGARDTRDPLSSAFTG